MLKNENGFSLAELMIAVGITGIVAYGGVTLMSNVSDRFKKNKIMAMRLEEIASIHRELQKSKKGIYRDNFLPSESFSYRDGIYKTGQWANVASEIGSYGAFSTSHSVQLVSSASRSSIIISRCVGVKDFDKHFNQFTDVYKLVKAPFIKSVVGKYQEIVCCERNGGDSCSGSINNNKSEYRVRTFIYNGRMLQQFPKFGDERYVPSTGFILTFNNTDNPFLFEMMIFSQSERCISAGQKDCTSNYLTSFQSLKGTISQGGINDSGLLQVK